MASSSKTKNLNLPQFSPQDKPSFLTDINPAFQSIDDAFTQTAAIVPDDGELGITAADFDRLYIGKDGIVRYKARSTNAPSS